MFLIDNVLKILAFTFLMYVLIVSVTRLYEKREDVQAWWAVLFGVVIIIGIGFLL